VPKIIKINRMCEQPYQAKSSHFLGQHVHVQIRLRCYLFLIFLSLHKQPFIIAQSQVITAHFVYHCTVFYALEIKTIGLHFV